MTAAIPLDGRMRFVRAWHGAHLKRGAHVLVDGENARVLSARDGRIAVRMWGSGRRVIVAPSEAVAA
jgi:hypothetical protein